MSRYMLPARPGRKKRTGAIRWSQSQGLFPGDLAHGPRWDRPLTDSLPPLPLWQLPAGTIVAERDLHPLKKHSFHGALNNPR